MRAAVYRRYGGPSVVTVEDLDTPRPRRRGGAGPGHGIRRERRRCRDALGHALRGATLRRACSAHACACSARSSPASSPATARASTGSRSAMPSGASPAPACARTPSTWSCPRMASSSPCPPALDPGRRRCAHRSDGAVVPRRHRRTRRGADDPHQRRVRCGGHVRGAAGRAPGRRRHGGVQRRARGARPRARRATRCSTTGPATSSRTLRAQGRTFDVVFDVFGNLGYRRARDLLTPTGRYCGTVPTLPILWHTLLTRRSSGQRGVIAFTGLRGEGCRAVRPA